MSLDSTRRQCRTRAAIETSVMLHASLIPRIESLSNGRVLSLMRPRDHAIHVLHPKMMAADRYLCHTAARAKKRNLQ